MDRWIEKELGRNFGKATRAGEAALASEPRAVKARYDARKQRLVVELANGVILLLPPALLQGLERAAPQQLAAVELSPLGTGLHWEDLDVDLSVAGLAAGVFGTRAWMSELARRAGSVKSHRKAASSRANGMKGGRPRKHTANGEGK